MALLGLHYSMCPIQYILVLLCFYGAPIHFNCTENHGVKTTSRQTSAFLFDRRKKTMQV